MAFGINRVVSNFLGALGRRSQLLPRPGSPAATNALTRRGFLTGRAWRHFVEGMDLTVPDEVSPPARPYADLMREALPPPPMLHKLSVHEVLFGRKGNPYVEAAPFEKGIYKMAHRYDALQGAQRPRVLSDDEVHALRSGQMPNQAWSLIDTDHGLINVLEAGRPRPDRPSLLFFVGTPDQIYPFYQLLGTLVLDFGLHAMAVEPPGYGWSGYSAFHDFTFLAMAHFRRMMFAKLGYENVATVEYSWAPIDASFETGFFGAEEIPVTKRIYLNAFDNLLLGESQKLDFAERIFRMVPKYARLAMRFGAWLPFVGIDEVQRDLFREELGEELFDTYLREWKKPWWKDAAEGAWFLTEETTSGIFQSWLRYLIAMDQTALLSQWAESRRANWARIPLHLIGFSKDQLIRGVRHTRPDDLQRALFERASKFTRARIRIVPGGHRGIMMSQALPGIIDRELTTEA